MAAPAAAAAVQRFFRSLFGKRKTGERVRTALFAVLDRHEALHIALDDFRERLDEAQPVSSVAVARGGEGDGAWVQWDFAEDTRFGDARIGPARWRFHASGLVLFNGAFRATRKKLAGDDLLGRRIELRTADGLLVGAWIAGFRVAAGASIDAHVSSRQFDHAALKRYFAELADMQTGQTIRQEADLGDQWRYSPSTE